MRAGLTGVVAVLCTCALGGGCGDDDDRPDRAAKPAAKGLERPVRETCVASGFGDPRIRAQTFSKEQGRAWTLQYTHRKASRPSSPDQTTVVLIVEFDPRVPMARLGGGIREITVDGRKVRFRQSPTVGETASNMAADWKTDRARYTLVANGTQASTAKRFIACMP